jgi:hypothetical protein
MNIVTTDHRKREKTEMSTTPTPTSTAEKHPSRSRRPRLLVVALVGAAVLAVVAGLGSPADARADGAKIRLGHFSPDTPEMDVYVTGFDGSETKVLEGLGYGQVSDYAPLDPGNYTFLLRPAGADPESDPAVTASAELEEGKAYTFAAMGPHADLQKALLTDDLAAPPAGQAKVRLIQASSTAGAVDVSAVDGPVLANDTAFATATGYAAVPAGNWKVDLTSSAVPADVQRELDLDAGTVNTLIVLEGSGGQGADLTRVVDATGVDASGEGPLGLTDAVPLGGVATGGGGTAGADSGGNGLAAPVMLGAGLALLVALGFGSRKALAVRSPKR